MKPAHQILAIALVALSLGACSPGDERVGGGALLGGATGGLIGAAATGRAGGALAGAVIGAAGGAILADATRPRLECVRVRYDEYGNAYCRRWARSY